MEFSILDGGIQTEARRLIVAPGERSYTRLCSDEFGRELSIRKDIGGDLERFERGRPA